MEATLRAWFEVPLRDDTITQGSPLWLTTVAHYFNESSSIH